MRYEGASRSPTASGCQTGTQALALAVKEVYPELQCLTSTYGCFNRRKIAGSSSWSLHAEGRAFDVGVKGPEKTRGWDLACDLVANRKLYGVQRVIWDDHIWSIERLDEWRRLSGGDKHLDHLHVEQYWTAARRPRSLQTAYEEQLRDGRRGKPD